MGNFLQPTINFTMFCSLISAFTCEDGISFTSNVFGERIADGSIPSSISYSSICCEAFKIFSGPKDVPLPYDTVFSKPYGTT